MATKAVTWAMVLGAGWTLVASGCTRPNDAFEEGGDPASGGASADGPTNGGTEEPTSAGTSATSIGGMTTDVVDDTGMETGASEAGTEEGTGAPLCELPPEAPIEITVMSGGIAPIPIPMPMPPLCEGILSFPAGRITVTASSLEYELCASCECLRPGPVLVLDFGTTLTPPPSVAGCRELDVWPRAAADGGCMWDGFVVGDSGGQPVYLAANSLDLPFPTAHLELSPGEPCDEPNESCGLVPGTRELRIGANEPIAAGTPETVALDVAGTLDYEITNRMSFVDQMCEEHVAWTALLVPDDGDDGG